MFFDKKISNIETQLADSIILHSWMKNQKIRITNQNFAAELIIIIWMN
jgi:hypothetical protein